MRKTFETGDRFGVEVVGRLVEQHECRAAPAEVCQAPRAGARRPIVWSRPRPRRVTSGRRRRVRASRSQFPDAGVVIFLQIRLFLKNLRHLLVRHRFGELSRSIERIEGNTLVSAAASSTLPPHVFIGVELRLLRGKKPIWMPDCGNASPVGIESVHASPPPLRNKRGFAGPGSGPSTPILAPGKNDSEISMRMAPFGVFSTQDAWCMV